MEMTVKQFKDFACTNRRLVLKDARNGREYTKIDKYLEKTVTGCFARIDTSDKHGSFAMATLVAWVRHEQELPTERD